MLTQKMSYEQRLDHLVKRAYKVAGIRDPEKWCAIGHPIKPNAMRDVIETAIQQGRLMQQQEDRPFHQALRQLADSITERDHEK